MTTRQHTIRQGSTAAVCLVLAWCTWPSFGAALLLLLAAGIVLGLATAAIMMTRMGR